MGKNGQDATLRNVRAANKRFEELADRVSQLATHNAILRMCIAAHPACPKEVLDILYPGKMKGKKKAGKR